MCSRNGCNADQSTTTLIDKPAKDCHRLTLGAARACILCYAQNQICYYLLQWSRTRFKHINYYFKQGDEHKLAQDLEALPN